MVGLGEMATDMMVRKMSGGSDQFVSGSRDRKARVSKHGAGDSDDRDVDVGIHGHKRTHERLSHGRASPELESSDTSEDGSSWMHGFETGDMVWGKVKSHPWWPGHIFHESFASLPVRRSRREGHVLVAFFGDSSYGWFEPAELLPFDPHFAEKSKQTTSRNFLKAVEEAVDEVSRRRALGISCLCRSPRNFRPASTPGYYAVDVIGYESGLVYSAREIKRARDDFVPVDVVSFLKNLAAAPHGAEQGSLNTTKMMATLLSIRKASYEEFDETYAQAFGVEPVRPSRNELGVVEPSAKIAPRGTCQYFLLVLSFHGRMCMWTYSAFPLDLRLSTKMHQATKIRIFCSRIILMPQKWMFFLCRRVFLISISTHMFVIH